MSGSGKVTVKDIARMAGVSIGTVDRTLHRRGRVAPKTEARIWDVIEKTGFIPNLHASQLAQAKSWTIGVLTPLAEQDSGFWKLPHDGMVRAAEELKPYTIKLDFHCFDRFSTEDFHAAAEQLLSNAPDAVLMAPVITDAALEFADKLPQGIPLCCFDADLPHPRVVAYIGQDSFASGKTAAKLMKMTVPTEKSIAVLQSHVEDLHINRRIEGFLSLYSAPADPPALFIRDHLDRDTERNSVMVEIVSSLPDLGGIFVVNDLVHRAAEFLGSVGREDIVLIGYDLIPENRKYLEGGTINFLLSQRPDVQGYRGVEILFKALSGQSLGSGRRIMPIDILIAENADFYIDDTGGDGYEDHT